MSTFHVMSDFTVKFTYFFSCGKSNTFQMKKEKNVRAQIITKMPSYYVCTPHAKYSYFT